MSYVYRVAVAMTAGSNFRTAATGMHSSVYVCIMSIYMYKIYYMCTK